MSPLETLNKVCHTSQRTARGHTYTLSDLRFPELNGKKIIAELKLGKYEYKWQENK